MMSELKYQVVITKGDGKFETDNDVAMDWLHWGPRRTERMGEYVATALKETTAETLFVDAHRQMVDDGHEVKPPSN